MAKTARVAQQAIHASTLHWRDPISSEEILKIATQGGARALGIFDQVGTLEVGKKADILIANANSMDHQPMQDPLFVAASVLVGRDVDTVLVDGQIVMRKREMLGVDVERIEARLKERMPVISERFERLVA